MKPIDLAVSANTAVLKPLGQCRGGRLSFDQQPRSPSLNVLFSSHHRVKVLDFRKTAGVPTLVIGIDSLYDSEGVDVGHDHKHMTCTVEAL